MIQTGMSQNLKAIKGFSLLELLVVIAIMAVIAALLLPVISRAKAKALRAGCMNNLRQIGLGVHMYADDSSDAFTPATNLPPGAFTAYTKFLKSYVGMTDTSPERARFFACPADTFYYDYKDRFSQSLHLQSKYDYSSYGFNGGNFAYGEPPASRWPGIAGRKLSSIIEPVKTVLVMEFPALLPYSWHEPVAASHYNDAQDMVSFVDGHVRLIRIYWDAAVTKNHIEAWQYDPPSGYDYKWSGD